MFFLAKGILKSGCLFFLPQALPLCKAPLFVSSLFIKIKGKKNNYFNFNPVIYS